MRLGQNGLSGKHFAVFTCLAATLLAAVVVVALLGLAHWSRRGNGTASPPFTPPPRPTAGDIGWHPEGSVPATPSPPTGPLRVNYEVVGFAKVAGYDYPDRAIGQMVCPAPKASTRIYGVAKPPAYVDDTSWRLVASKACDQPSWMNDVSWLGSGDAAQLPALSDLPTLGWPAVDSWTKPPPENGPVGVAASDMGAAVNGYAVPGRKGRPLCSIPNGSEVRALASTPDQSSLDILVHAAACPSPVWIWVLEVQWKGEEWMSVGDRIPDVHPQLLGERKPPEMAATPGETRVPFPDGVSADSVRLLVRDTEGRPHAWQRALPTQWAASASEATLLATVRQVPEMIEVCHYIPMGVIYRVQPAYDVTLSLANPTQIVARTTLRGGIPSGCPGGVTVKIGSGSDPWQVGPEPDPQELVSWVRALVGHAPARRE